MNRTSVVNQLPNRAPEVQIYGAGLSGLTAALTAVKYVQQVCVYERSPDVGSRFHGDFQGLENWTSSTDVLEELSELGIAHSFEYTPVHEVIGYTPNGRERAYRSQKPLFYLVKRGSEEGSLDYSLKQQVLAAGVDIRFSQAAEKTSAGGVVTQGPHRADVIAGGYLFDTHSADGMFVAVSDRLAPKGYAYLLVQGGRGTLATCMYADFHNEGKYRERTVEFFRERVGVSILNPHRFGGSGNFSIPGSATKDNILYAGESAGFQDALFGFGMRYAILSGHMAGRAYASGQVKGYDELWKRRFLGLLRMAAVNRRIYELLGNAGYELLMKRYSRSRDVHEWMHRAYVPTFWKGLLYRLQWRSTQRSCCSP